MQQKSCSCSGKPTDAAILAEVQKLASQYKGQPDKLIQVLKEVQAMVGFNAIPKDVGVTIAFAVGIPVKNVYDVVSFYAMFTDNCRGKYVIRICKSAPCHVKGAQEVMDAISEEIGIGFGETTADCKFTLETCECLGICAESPAMMVNDDVYSNLTPAKAKEIIKAY